MQRILLFIFSSLCLGSLFAREGDPVEEPHISVRMVADTSSIQAGQSFYLGVEYTMEEAWHIYWKNPGDTGIPTNIQWQLPEGFKAGELKWPTPKIYLMGGLMNYVYENTVILMAEITAPATLPENAKYIFKARSDWLICKDICIPGGADLALEIPSSGPSEGEMSNSLQQSFALNQANWPSKAADRELTVRAYDGDDSLYLSLEFKSLAASNIDLKTLYFFEDNMLNRDENGYPFSPTIDANAAQSFKANNDTISVKLSKSEWGPENIEKIGGVLGTAQGGISFETKILDSPPPNSVSPAEVPQEPIHTLLMYAFVGGLILNLMPCVFPVIGIKIMGFVNQAGEDRKKVAAHGVVFSLGVISSLMILCVVFLALRSGGASLGWGFQFQNPAMPYGLSILFLIFAMNMSGVFEFGTSAMGIGQKHANKTGLIGTFFSGILAVVVSTPCSGPAFGSALGALIVLPSHHVTLLSLSIGLGLAFPYLILSFFPGLVKRLPRPGAWMESFKQAMAFLLYGSAIVMFTVFANMTQQNEKMGSFAGIIAAGAITVVAFGIWVYGRWAGLNRSPRSRKIGTSISIVLVAGGSILGYPRESDISWESWSPERVEAAIKNGDTVYVDFTAQWCITCQTNKRFALYTDAVIKRIINDDVVLLKADWTDSDPAITEELARFQRIAVPFNLVYGPALEKPLILPEILTPNIILDAFDEAQGKE